MKRIIELYPISKFIAQFHTFKQAWSKNACCVSDKKGSFHRRCICDAQPDSKSCAERCIDDANCKGYVIFRLTSIRSCHLATTSSCPSECRGPFNSNNVDSLKPGAFCGTRLNAVWNGGCFIKRGKTY